MYAIRIILSAVYFVICASFFWGAAIASAQEWLGVDYSADTEQSYVNLDFSSPVSTPSISFLEGQTNRLVLDWDSLSTNISGKAIGQGQTELAGQGAVDRFRFARRGANGLRLVLDLDGAAAYKGMQTEGRQLKLIFASNAQPIAYAVPTDRFDYTVPIPRLNPRRNATPQTARQPITTVRPVNREIYTPKKREFKIGEIPYPRTAPHLGAGQLAVDSAYRPQVTRPQKPVIVIDPGHGGYDPGAIGAKGTKEKVITTAVTARLAAALRQTGRYDVVTTRSRDVYVEHDDRLRIARERGGDLFISLHADSTADGKASGASVYTLADRSKNRSKKITHTQNWILDVDLTEQTASVGDILVDLAQRKTLSHSSQFAARLVSELEKEVPLVRNTHRRAGYYVLLAPDVPAVLLELGFISNAADEARLNKVSEQKKIINAVMRAINGYFDAKKP